MKSLNEWLVDRGIGSTDELSSGEWLGTSLPDENLIEGQLEQMKNKLLGLLMNYENRDELLNKFIKSLQG